MSHASTEDSSGRSSPAVSIDEHGRHSLQAAAADESGLEPANDSFTLPEEDDVLKYAMGVVKSVKDLSDKIHKCKPNDYVDLVKASGWLHREYGTVHDASTGLSI